MHSSSKIYILTTKLLQAKRAQIQSRVSSLLNQTFSFRTCWSSSQPLCWTQPCRLHCFQDNPPGRRWSDLNFNSPVVGKQKTKRKNWKCFKLTDRTEPAEAPGPISILYLTPSYSNTQERTRKDDTRICCCCLHRADRNNKKNHQKTTEIKGCEAEVTSECYFYHFISSNLLWWLFILELLHWRDLISWPYCRYTL